MKRSVLFLTGLCLFVYPSQAQFTVLGADAFGRANSLVAVPGYASIYQNPAGIAEGPSGFLAFNYLRIVPVQGLGTTGVQGVFAGKLLNYGFSVDSFGDRHYRETRAGLALARRQDRVSLGMKLSYLGRHAAGARSGLLAEAGMMVTPASYVSLGLRLAHLPSTLVYEGHPFPTVLSLGAGVYPNSGVKISGQVDYRTGSRVVVRFGLHYQPREQLGFSAGINPEMRSVHFGVNVMAGRYGFFYGIATHPYVGIAHHTTLLYKIHD